jgi:cobalt-zinc-cadmium efflux system protein
MNGHTHDHRSHPPTHGRTFAIGVALNLAFVAAELTFGLLANSLALIADAAHNFSDVVGLLLAWGGTALARRQPTARRTYGYRSASILAALGNAALLLMAIGAIAFEAVQRIAQPAPVAGATILWVAAAGVVINTATALLFVRGRDDINIRGAFLHMAADAAVSLGVVVAALLIMATGWPWLDPAVSLAIAAVIFLATWGLARDSVNLALGAVPPHIDREAVEGYLRGLAGVTDVHDLHIWAMSTTETALTAHLVRPDAELDDALLAGIREKLAHDFGIAHATLQVERGDAAYPCPQAAREVV